MAMLSQIRAGVKLRKRAPAAPAKPAGGEGVMSRLQPTAAGTAAAARSDGSAAPSGGSSSASHTGQVRPSLEASRLRERKEKEKADKIALLKARAAAARVAKARVAEESARRSAGEAAAGEAAPPAVVSPVASRAAPGFLSQIRTGGFLRSKPSPAPSPSPSPVPSPVGKRAAVSLAVSKKLSAEISNAPLRGSMAERLQAYDAAEAAQPSTSTPLRPSPDKEGVEVHDRRSVADREAKATDALSEFRAARLSLRTGEPKRGGAAAAAVAVPPLKVTRIDGVKSAREALEQYLEQMVSASETSDSESGFSSDEGEEEELPPTPPGGPLWSPSELLGFGDMRRPSAAEKAAEAAAETARVKAEEEAAKEVARALAEKAAAEKAAAKKAAADRVAALLATAEKAAAEKAAIEAEAAAEKAAAEKAAAEKGAAERAALEETVAEREAAFQISDIDGDGVVTREEQRKMAGRGGLTAMQFAQADADADGRVTQSELQAMPSPRAELLAALAVLPPDRAARVKSLRERAIAARLAKHRVAAEAASAAALTEAAAAARAAPAEAGGAEGAVAEAAAAEAAEPEVAVVAEPTAAELARERAIAARLARASVASRRASAAEASWRGSAAEASRRASAAEATEGAEETEEEAEEAGPEALAAAAAPAEAAPAEAAPVESAGAASGELVFSDTLATPSSERVAERLARARGRKAPATKTGRVAASGALTPRLKLQLLRETLAKRRSSSAPGRRPFPGAEGGGGDASAGNASAPGLRAGRGVASEQENDERNDDIRSEAKAGSGAGDSSERSEGESSQSSESDSSDGDADAEERLGLMGWMRNVGKVGGKVGKVRLRSASERVAPRPKLAVGAISHLRPGPVDSKRRLSQRLPSFLHELEDAALRRDLETWAGSRKLPGEAVELLLAAGVQDVAEIKHLRGGDALASPPVMEQFPIELRDKVEQAVQAERYSYATLD